MGSHTALRRVLALVGLSLWLVVGAASATLAYPVPDGQTGGRQAGCELPHQILRIEPRLWAACSGIESRSPTVDEPAIGEEPATAESSGFPVHWVIWPVVTGTLAVAAVLLIGPRHPQRATF